MASRLVYIYIKTQKVQKISLESTVLDQNRFTTLQNVKLN